jgi:glycosyltransferase involved in cell wall biosynthesis
MRWKVSLTALFAPLERAARSRWPLQVLFVVRGDPFDAPSSRYRVFQYLPEFDRKGISYRVVKPPRRKIVLCHLWIPWLCRSIFLGLCSRTIFIQKDIFWLPLWRFFKGLGKRVLYDFDDAVFTELPGQVYSLPLERRPGWVTVREMVHLSDVTMVANEYLATFARPFSSDVRVIPMALDLHNYPVKIHRPGEPVVIGWIGSPQTSGFLELVREALARVAEKHGDKVEIRIITNGQVSLPEVRHTRLPWEAAREIADLLSFDIGIVPLPETPFTLGKSSFKLLQFMGCGLPVVCSPVGFNAEAVRDGENGLLADGCDEWCSQLSRLMSDHLMRRAMGARARRTIEERFSLQSQAPVLRQVVTDL